MSQVARRGEFVYDGKAVECHRFKEAYYAADSTAVGCGAGVRDAAGGRAPGRRAGRPDHLHRPGWRQPDTDRGAVQHDRRGAGAGEQYHQPERGCSGPGVDHPRAGQQRGCYPGGDSARDSGPGPNRRYRGYGQAGREPVPNRAALWAVGPGGGGLQRNH